jgi:hypothetical protein
MTAEEFTAFVYYVKEEFGAWEYQLAKSMGVTRQTIAQWKLKGTPAWADLVASAVIAGLDPWRPEPEHLPNPSLRSQVS